MAIFTGFFEWLRRWCGWLENIQFFRLGDAGFNGFEQQVGTEDEIALIGGHSAFLDVQNAVRFASAYVTQDVDFSGLARLAEARGRFSDGSGGSVGAVRPPPTKWVDWANRLAWAVWLGLVNIVAAFLGISAVAAPLAVGITAVIWRYLMACGLGIGAIFALVFMVLTVNSL